MKRVGLLLSAFLIISMLSACSSGGSGSSVSATPDVSTPPTSSHETGSSSAAASSSDPAATEKTKFEQFEAGLDELGIKYEKVTMGADLVGAQEGVKYKLSDGNVELYKFDTSTDAYKTAVKKTRQLPCRDLAIFQPNLIMTWPLFLMMKFPASPTFKIYLAPLRNK